MFKHNSDIYSKEIAQGNFGLHNKVREVLNLYITNSGGKVSRYRRDDILKIRNFYNTLASEVTLASQLDNYITYEFKTKWRLFGDSKYSKLKSMLFTLVYNYYCYVEYKKTLEERRAKESTALVLKKRHNEEIARMNASHDRRIIAMQDIIDGLKKQLATVMQSSSHTNMQRLSGLVVRLQQQIIAAEGDNGRSNLSQNISQVVVKTASDICISR